jgi:hypothetical protein
MPTIYNKMATVTATTIATAQRLSRSVLAEETASGPALPAFVGAPPMATGLEPKTATGAGSTVSQRLPTMPTLLQTQTSPFQVHLLLHQAASYWKYAI